MLITISRELLQQPYNVFLLFIFGVINGAVNSPDYVESNDNIVVNNVNCAEVTAV